MDYANTIVLIDMGTNIIEKYKTCQHNQYHRSCFYPPLRTMSSGFSGSCGSGGGGEVISFRAKSRGSTELSTCRQQHGVVRMQHYVTVVIIVSGVLRSASIRDNTTLLVLFHETVPNDSQLFNYMESADSRQQSRESIISNSSDGSNNNKSKLQSWIKPMLG